MKSGREKTSKGKVVARLGRGASSSEGRLSFRRMGAAEVTPTSAVSAAAKDLPPTRGSWIINANARALKSYSLLNQFNVTDRVDLIRQGIPAAAVTDLKQNMQVSKGALLEWLNVPEPTFNRTASAKKRLSPEVSERVLDMMMLVGKVEMMVQESGQPEGFDAAKWTANWLARPSPALGGETPGSFLDTSLGRAMVSKLISQVQSSAYA